MNNAKKEAKAQDTPPSFAPSRNPSSRPHRSGNHEKPRDGNAPLKTNPPDVVEPSNRSVPPVFSPAKDRRTSQPMKARKANSTAPSRVDSPSAATFRPTASRHTDAAPVVRPRRAEGSSAVLMHDASEGLQTYPPKANRTPHAPRTRRGQSPTPLAQPPRHRHRILKTFGILMVLLLLTGTFLAFSTWNWVDSRLRKMDWSTGAANTQGTSWLILGSDERDSSGIGGSAKDVPGFRTDTILILTKPQRGPSSLISVPRDSLVEVDGDSTKINAVDQLYGKKELIRQTESITGKNIDHVAQLRFEGLQNVVDALGGINLCYDSTVSDPYSGLNWTAGCHTADGGTALAFSRMRYADPTGDFGRAKRQRSVIGAIIKKATSKEVLSNPTTVKKLATNALNALQVDNNTNPKVLAEMAQTFKNATGPGGISGSLYWSDPDYYVDGVGSSVLLNDKKNLQLFNDLSLGTHSPGSVGSLSENVSQ